MLGERREKGPGLFEVCKWVLVGCLCVFEYGKDASDEGDGRGLTEHYALREATI